MLFIYKKKSFIFVLIIKTLIIQDISNTLSSLV